MRKVTAIFIVVLGLGAGIMFGETIKNAFGVESGGKENITQHTTTNKKLHEKPHNKLDKKHTHTKKDRVKNAVKTSTNTPQENWDKVKPLGEVQNLGDAKISTTENVTREKEQRAVGNS